MFRTTSVFDEMLRSFDNLFRGALQDDLGTGARALPGSSGMARRRFLDTGFPPVEVARNGESLEFRAELPGVDPEDVQIDVKDGVLTLRGEKRRENEQNREGDVFYREFWSGSFERSFTLPEGVEADDIQASYRNGMLTITLPHVPALQAARRVPIQMSEGESNVKQIEEKKSA